MFWKVCIPFPCMLSKFETQISLIFKVLVEWNTISNEDQRQRFCKLLLCFESDGIYLLWSKNIVGLPRKLFSFLSQVLQEMSANASSTAISRTIVITIYLYPKIGLNIFYFKSNPMLHSLLILSLYYWRISSTSVTSIGWAFTLHKLNKVTTLV